MMHRCAPIFIVGSSRSGTTLISSCLRRHPNIHITNETHYFDDLRPRLMRRAARGSSCDLREEACRYFRRLDAGLYALAEAAQRSPLESRPFETRIAQFGDDADACFEAFCVAQAERHGRFRWGEKTPRHIYQLDAIFGRFPDARVIFMVRDPRAVAASYRHWKYEGPRRLNDPEALAPERRRAERSYHPLILAMMWRSGVRSALVARARYGPESVAAVRYEDLAADPHMTLSRVCAFLDETFAPEMLDVPAENSSFAAFDRSGGIHAESVERWRSQLSRSEIAAIQSCCRAGMRTFEYQLMPGGPAALAAAAHWITLPFAVGRAVAANRSRIGNLPGYLWRRIRGAPLTEVGHA